MKVESRVAADSFGEDFDVLELPQYDPKFISCFFAENKLGRFAVRIMLTTVENGGAGRLNVVALGY